MVHSLTIRYEGLALAAFIHYPPQAGQSGDRMLPLVIINHSFVGSRGDVDDLFVLAAEKLAEQGHLVLRFDYACWSQSEENYGDHVLDAMIKQTRTVLDYALAHDIVDPCRVTLLGHNLGGAVALLTAARDRRVKSLVLWSPSGYPFNETMRNEGRCDALLQRQPPEELQEFPGDVLLVHGTEDETISVEYAHMLEKTFWLRSEGYCKKAIILQADHTYSRSEHKEELFKATTDWLNGYDYRMLMNF